MAAAADDAVNLAHQTPHRLMPELYEQFIAYGRAYNSALPNYTAPDDVLAQANTAAAQTITQICAATDSGSAVARAKAVAPVATPTEPPTVDDLANSERFLTQAGPTCARWIPAVATSQTGTQGLDATGRGRSARSVQAGTAGRSGRGDAAVRSKGRRDGDRGSWQQHPIEDFATRGAVYLRAYVAGVPTYVPADRDLAWAGLGLDDLISSACQAAGR